MEDSTQLLTIDSAPRPVNWVTAEAAYEVLAALLLTLRSDTHTLVADLLSLMCHNTREILERVDWAEEYEILPMNFL